MGVWNAAKTIGGIATYPIRKPFEMARLGLIPPLYGGIMGYDEDVPYSGALSALITGVTPATAYRAGNAYDNVVDKQHAKINKQIEDFTRNYKQNPENIGFPKKLWHKLKASFGSQSSADLVDAINKNKAKFNATIADMQSNKAVKRGKTIKSLGWLAAGVSPFLIKALLPRRKKSFLEKLKGLFKEGSVQYKELTMNEQELKKQAAFELGFLTKVAEMEKNAAVDTKPVYHDGNQLTKMLALLGAVPGAALGGGIGNAVGYDNKGTGNRSIDTILGALLGGGVGAFAGGVPGYALDTIINRIKAPVEVQKA